jgi:small GTP-binding protein
MNAKHGGKESRPHIGIYGRRNNGKSSLINAIAGQDIAIVSDHAGTTTDPVKKSFEITGYGPVILIDTAGTDDSGDLGEKRVERTIRTLEIIDMAILLVTDNKWEKEEEILTEKFMDLDIPFIIVHSKSDLVAPDNRFREEVLRKGSNGFIEFSAYDRRNYEELINLIKATIQHLPFLAI